jgi:ANTAR domain
MTGSHGQTQSPASPSGAAADAGRAGTGDRAEAAATAADDSAVVLRTKDGWRVGGTDMTDLTSAMVLADLLSAELPGKEGEKAPHGSAASDRPSGRPDAASETGKLRATVRQLEHALTARIRVEQAIGVLAERHRIQPRQAFEQLRSAARNRGRRVIDIAADVVASATNPLLQLPDELSRPRSAGLRARQARGLLGSD